MNANTRIGGVGGVFAPQKCFEFDSSSGQFVLDRAVYTDPQIFDLEMEKIFEGNWIYLGHESQLPKPGDYMVASMGRREVIVVRGRDNVVRGLVNHARTEEREFVERKRETSGFSLAHIMGGFLGCRGSCWRHSVRMSLVPAFRARG